LLNSVLKPSGKRGALSFSGTLHQGQGAPAPPQVQACSPSHGRSGWLSQIQSQSSHREHFIQRRIAISTRLAKGKMFPKTGKVFSKRSTRRWNRKNASVYKQIVFPSQRDLGVNRGTVCGVGRGASTTPTDQLLSA
jgi:hypothetical protein